VAELRGGSGLQDAARFDHNDEICKVVDVLGVMGDEKCLDGPSREKCLQCEADLSTTGAIQRSEGLIEEQKSWLGSEATGEGHPLQLTSGELGGEMVAQVMEFECRQKFCEACGLTRGRPVGDAEGDVAGDGEVGEQSGVLGGPPHSTSLRREAEVATGIDPELGTAANPAVLDSLQPGQDAEQGTFARA